MTKSFRTVLPLEVQELIIDDVQDDKDTLRTFSFVCRNWRLRSYSHTFAEISLSHATVGSLSEFLAVEFSTEGIFPQVRRVSLNGAPDFCWSSNQLQSLSAILATLAGVDRARALILENLCWQGLGPCIPALLTCLSNITSLEIKHVSFPTCAQFTAFVSNFSYLRHANFEDLVFIELDNFIPPNPCSVGCQSSKSSCEVSFRGSGSFLRKHVKWTCTDILSIDSRADLPCLGMQTAHTAEASALLRVLGARLNQLDIISGCTSSSSVS